MANPKINISSLDFDGIKTSLKEYLSNLKNSDGTLKFPGYDFEGSGMDTLLGIMAYNTLYYSFYSNMIANETYLDTAQLENNIVSLVKPLGYLVPGKTCSRSEVSATSINSTYTLTAYTDFLNSYSNSGINYRFYPIQNVSLSSGVSTTFTVYEAKSVVKDLQLSVDVNEQKAFLGTTDVDINTVTVKVNGVVWDKYDNYEVIPGSDNTVYFIDRTSNGFYVLFGRKTLNDYQSTFGKPVQSNDVVTVSYLVPTGTDANNLTSLTNTSLNISGSTSTSNGTDAPDLDLVKFFAPKMFAANDRAVTKEDFYGLLLSGKVLPSSISQTGQINVWGGEEADPPSFGRVFVSFADLVLTASSPEVKKSISYLKNKSIVTVLPEYVQPQPVLVSLNVVISGNVADINTNAVKILLETTYNTDYFNNSLSLADIKSTITSAYSGVKNVNISSGQLSLNVTGSGGNKTLFFKNELLVPTTSTSNTVTSDTFSYGSKTVRLINVPNDTNNFLIAKDTSTNVLDGEVVGKIDYTKGVVSIQPGVIPTDTTVAVSVYVKYPDDVIVKDELLSTLITNVTKG